MNLTSEQRATLLQTADAVLRALEAIAESCATQLNDETIRDPQVVLGAPHNWMAHGPSSAVQQLGRTASELRQSLHRLSREPFIARSIVRWEGQSGTETLYFSRASAASVTDAAPDGRVITYTAAIGRIAEFEAGENATIHAPGGTRHAEVLERIRLRPERTGAEWDAIEGNAPYRKVAVLSRYGTSRKVAATLGLVNVVPPSDEVA